VAWQWLIRGWLAGAAKQELYAAAQEMLRQQLRRQQGDAGDAARALPPPCDVGLIFPSAAEAAGVVDRLGDSVTVAGHGFDLRLGRFAERHVAIASAPAERAGQAAEALLRGHRPTLLIAAGFAESLSSSVSREDVVLATEIVQETQDNGIAIFPTALADLGQPIVKRPGMHLGRLVTWKAAIPAGDQRLELGRRLDALAADETAAAVAEACRQCAVPLLAVYVIRHGVKEAASRELRHLRRQTSVAGKLGAFLGVVTRRPGTVKEMVQSAEHALVAGDRLAEVLGELLGLLPGQADHGAPSQK